jgi:hypothetical protein
VRDQLQDFAQLRFESIVETEAMERENPGVFTKEYLWSVRWTVVEVAVTNVHFVEVYMTKAVFVAKNRPGFAE